VRDEYVREVELPLQVVEEVDDLRLDRHVEGRHRLVAYDQLRPQRERAGDADALPLAAGELVRGAGGVLRGEPNQLQQRLHGGLGALRGGDLVDPQRSTDDRTDGVPRVQRRVRVLEDHLYVPAQRSHGAGGQVRDVAVLEDDLPAGRFEQPGHQ